MFQNYDEMTHAPFFNRESITTEPATSSLVFVLSNKFTMLVSDTLTRFHRCHCLGHVERYASWPWTDAELGLATCMRWCPYCGYRFASAGKLREYLRGQRYKQRNLDVKIEAQGRCGV